ncbi:DUF6160 family protein [Atopomonas hussainii]|uniref:DUF6160 family protein n=1 Tax=Atopomonas hussainii TaxID=1429083 RepID=UPI0008FFF0D8|nr:DUF6160 family protein [Atopomonas hussainii]
MFKKILSQLSFSLLLGVSFTAQAELVPLSDEKLSEVTGQAFMNMTTDSHNGLTFTRLNLGVEIATQMNVKKLELGNYSRAGEAAGSADISINNFALGSVNDATGQINPFHIKNPYLEIAYSGTKVVGLRMGFGEAKGHLSGDINRITGNIPVDIYGTGSYLSTQMNCSFFDVVCKIARSAVGGLYANREFAAEAQLVTSPGGDPDPVRAQYIGMVDGQGLSIPTGNDFDDFILGLFTSTNCALLSAPTCFPLSNYGSFPVGRYDHATQQFTDAAKGVFLSMQTQNVPWRDQQDATKFVNALAGAFMNLPRNADGSAAIRTSFQEAFEGIARVDTCLGTQTKGC